MPHPARPPATMSVMGKSLKLIVFFGKFVTVATTVFHFEFKIKAGLTNVGDTAPKGAFGLFRESVELFW